MKVMYPKPVRVVLKEILGDPRGAPKAEVRAGIESSKPRRTLPMSGIPSRDHQGACRLPKGVRKLAHLGSFSHFSYHVIP